MKKRLKLAGAAALGALLIGGGLYANALRIPGEPLLTRCWTAELIDKDTGQKVVGAEDMDFDPVTGAIFISAYDRRAVAREIAAGKVTTQGGIYALNVSDISGAAILPVRDLTRDYKTAHEFRPHGIAFARDGEAPLVVAINRLYANGKGAPVLDTAFEEFRFSDSGMAHAATRRVEGVCDPYDIAATGGGEALGFAFTDVARRCQGGWFTTAGSVWAGLDGMAARIAEGLSFPNGIVADGGNLFVAETRSHALVKIGPDGTRTTFSLPVGPDNITDGGARGILIAGFPNLLDYYFYLQGWLGVGKSPSAAYRFDHEKQELRLLFKDDGSLISGATVALRAGDYLLLGAAWDDHIALCSGLDRIS